MSAKGQEDPGEDLASRVGAESPCSDMKRAAAKKLIERYFYQLIDGCGNPQCDNQYCASSGKVTNLTPNQAAAQAIQLFSQEARLCDRTQPNKVARTSLEPGPASLAKRLPVKSMNPTCSIEGTASKSGLIDASPSPEKLSRQVEAVAVSSTEPATREAPDLDTKVSPSPDNDNAERMVAKPTTKKFTTKVKRKSVREPPERDTQKTRVDRREKRETSSSTSRDSRDETSPARITSRNNARFSIRRIGKSDKRRREPAKARKREVKKSANSKDRRKPRRPRARRRNNRSSQSFVRELLVLALYLRYLESKRYSRNHGGKNDFFVPP